MIGKQTVRMSETIDCLHSSFTFCDNFVGLVPSLLQIQIQLVFMKEHQ